MEDAPTIPSPSPIIGMYGMYGIPLEAQVLYRRGTELSDRPADEAAVKYLRQAIIIAPRFAGAYRSLGFCLARLGRGDEAVYCYQRLSRIEPGGTGVAGNICDA
jgi:tetratricopeptide (TPR) repeat protein